MLAIGCQLTYRVAVIVAEHRPDPVASHTPYLGGHLRGVARCGSSNRRFRQCEPLPTASPGSCRQRCVIRPSSAGLQMISQEPWNLLRQAALCHGLALEDLVAGNLGRERVPLPTTTWTPDEQL